MRLLRGLWEPQHRVSAAGALRVEVDYSALPLCADGTIGLRVTDAAGRALVADVDWRAGGADVDNGRRAQLRLSVELVGLELIARVAPRCGLVRECVEVRFAPVRAGAAAVSRQSAWAVRVEGAGDCTLELLADGLRLAGVAGELCRTTGLSLRNDYTREAAVWLAPATPAPAMLLYFADRAAKEGCLAAHRLCAASAFLTTQHVLYATAIPRLDSLPGQLALLAEEVEALRTEAAHRPTATALPRPHTTALGFPAFSPRDVLADFSRPTAPAARRARNQHLRARLAALRPSPAAMDAAIAVLSQRNERLAAALNRD